MNNINEIELVKLYNQKVAIKQLCTQFNCSKSTIYKKLHELGIIKEKDSKQEMKTMQDKKEQIKNLYLNGLSCKEIGDKLNLSERTVNYHLHKMNITISSVKKISQEKFEELWNQNKTDKEIADYFGVEEITIKSFRTRGKNAGKFKRTNHFSEQERTLTDLQEQFIYGSLLGDLNIGKPNKIHPNCRLYLVHSQKQEELFMKKVEILGEFMGAYKLTNLTPDKRTGKIYPTYRGNSKAHPIFTEIYNELYINGIKTITQQFLDKINSPIALAFWFMDDGCNDGILATNGFTLNEVELLQKWLDKKWNIQSSIQKNRLNHVLYIKQESRKHFEELIFPYIIPSMYYKLKFLPQLAESVG